MFSFKRSLIALVGVLVLVGVLAALMPLVSQGQGGNPLTRDTRRSFYLTQTTHNGSQALTACAAGYHMASLWEIFDPSDLKYDTQLGFIRDDSGFGPPTGSIAAGWIRTGQEASAGVGSPGQNNCNAWRSASDVDAGTAVNLPPNWNEGGGNVSPWLVRSPTCNSTEPVWCVQD